MSIDPNSFELSRGVVRQVNTTTGTSQVEVPAYLGSGGLVPVANVGLTQLVPGVFDMPTVGSSVFVASDVHDRCFYVGPPSDVIARTIGASVSLLDRAFATAADTVVYNNATAFTTAALVPYYGRRNLLHNGDDRVRQFAGTYDGSSASMSLTNIVTFGPSDRWYAGAGIAGVTETWYSFNNAGAGGDVAPWSNEMIIQCPQKAVLVAGDNLTTFQRLEGRDVQKVGFGTASAQPLTLSFWIQPTTAGTYIAELTRCNGVASFATPRAVSVPFTVTTGRQKITLTFPADTGGVCENSDNLMSLQLLIVFAAGSTYQGGTLNTRWTTGPASNTRFNGCTNSIAPAGTMQINLAERQLEIGTVATQFEYRDYADELIICQRYFQVWQQPPLRGVMTTAANTTAGRMGMPLPVTMRAAPTATITGALPLYDGSNVGTVNTIAASYCTPQTAELDFTTTIAAGGGTNRSVVIYQSVSNQLLLDARI